MQRAVHRVHPCLHARHEGGKVEDVPAEAHVGHPGVYDHVEKALNFTFFLCFDVPVKQMMEQLMERTLRETIKPGVSARPALLSGPLDACWHDSIQRDGGAPHLRTGAKKNA